MAVQAQAVVLFDVDGTLLNTTGAGSRAFRRAVQQWLGRPLDLSGLEFMGRTDLEILRQVVEQAGVPYPEGEALRRLFRNLSSLVTEELQAQPAGRACPGVGELLGALQADPRWALGLLTGNSAGAAEAKLRHFALDPYFSFGAYGDDAEDRHRLVPIALERLARRSGTRVPPSRTVLIGDTERDIECARSAGAAILAVATGFASLETLERSGPDALFSDLTDVPAVMRALKGLASLPEVQEIRTLPGRRRPPSSSPGRAPGRG